jgi:hypothetical protein
MKITLSPRELAMCDMIASMRYWQGCGTDSTIIDKRKASRLGFTSEYAFSKQFNLHLDIISNLEKDSFDFISKDGATIDIKSTDRKDGNLVVPKLMHDVYVLAIVDGNTVDLVGYATKQMIEEAGRKDLGNGLVWFVNRKQLKTW